MSRLELFNRLIHWHVRCRRYPNGIRDLPSYQQQLSDTEAVDREAPATSSSPRRNTRAGFRFASVHHQPALPRQCQLTHKHTNLVAPHLRRLLLVALTVAIAAPVIAHHSISGQYNLNERATLRGVIARVDWINPHPYVYLDMTEVDGSVTTWALATVPLPMLRKAQLTKEMVAGSEGEIVTIEVLPGLNGTKQGWITKITYADGHFYQLSGR